MTIAPAAPIVGRQDPTFLWVPPADDSLGREVIELAAAAGLILDPWQERLVEYACATDPAGAWQCFEVAIVVSRQNGKGAVLAALELAWLFLFGDRLIIHSAHLFETSREHFLKMQALIGDHQDFSRRVRRMREGRGSEEIELMGGQRLKFMTRKGGAGRGFTGNKVVLDEAMYLDAMMMAAALPTLATVPNSQVIYTGSAGMKHSTQLGSVRRRGYRQSESRLMYAEWAAEKATYDGAGELMSGDDPTDVETWAKANPALGIRLTREYVEEKEMPAFGGPHSPAFATERLGIGDWPEGEEQWEIIGKEVWESRADPASVIPDGAGIALSIEADTDRSMGTITACGMRDDKRRHLEVVERHRGTSWIVERVVELKAKHRIRAVAILKTSAAANLITALERAGLAVYSPTEVEYAQACGDLYEAVVESDTVRHIGQASLNAAVAGARVRTSVEGGWRWSRDVAADPAPIIGATLARWAHERYAIIPRSKVW